ncbi:MAG: hypothetical protein ABL901_07940 [Hyphomicrobiaceae bacterium]
MRMQTASTPYQALALVLCLAVAGCSNAPLPSLTTGSLFGSKPDAQAAAAAPAQPVVRNDPMMRTLQVSRTAAKAQRCGFNFDAAKLKGGLMASEGTQGGVDVAELAKLDKVYSGSFNGTMKATSADEGYCSDGRTKHIKAELARHLAGDYAPGDAFKDPNADDDGGIFSGSGGLLDPNSQGGPPKQATPGNVY